MIYVAIGQRTNKIYESDRFKSVLLNKLSEYYPTLMKDNVHSSLKGRRRKNIYPEPILIKKVENK